MVKGNGSSTGRVLILEDTASLLRLYSKALLNAGYEVHLAGTLDGARELLDTYRFDVFVCDILLGKELGTDLLMEKRELLSETGTQAVIVSGESQYCSLCDEMGLEFFLQKPISVKSLIDLIDRLAGRSEPVGCGVVAGEVETMAGGDCVEL